MNNNVKNELVDYGVDIDSLPSGYKTDTVSEKLLKRIKHKRLVNRILGTLAGGIVGATTGGIIGTLKNPWSSDNSGKYALIGAPTGAAVGNVLSGYVDKKLNEYNSSGGFDPTFHNLKMHTEA